MKSLLTLILIHVSVLIYLFVPKYMLNGTQVVKNLNNLDSVQILLLNKFQLSNYLQNYGYILIKLKSTHHNMYI